MRYMDYSPNYEMKVVTMEPINGKLTNSKWIMTILYWKVSENFWSGVGSIILIEYWKHGFRMLLWDQEQEKNQCNWIYELI